MLKVQFTPETIEVLSLIFLSRYYIQCIEEEEALYHIVNRL